MSREGSPEAEETPEFNFEEWSNGIGLTKKTTAALNKEDVTSHETLCQMNDDDVICLGLTLGQRKLLCSAIAKLRGDAGHDGAPLQTATAPDEEALPVEKTVTATPAARENAVPAATADPPTTLKALRDLPSTLDQGKSFYDIFADLPDTLHTTGKVDDSKNMFDPRSLLSLKATKSKSLHITDFLPESVKKRRMSRQREMVLSTSGTADDVLILRTDDNHPYTGISLSEWGAANCRLMAALLDRQLLPPADTHYYLAYTMKIFEFVSKYEWESVLEFDYRYREIQAEHGMKWGIHAPDLELHILERRQRQRPSMTAKARASQPTRPLIGQHPTPVSREECRQFKANGWCRFGPDCRYDHPRLAAPPKDSANPGVHRQ